MTRRFLKRRPLLGLTTFALLCTFVVFGGSQSPAQQNSQPSWELQNGRLVYGWQGSDVVGIIITCRDGMADVDIMVRPPHGKAGDKTPIKFKNGASEGQHTATLTELDGLSGDDVEFSILPSDKLFDFLIRGGAIVAQVPGASLTLPAQNGRVRAAMAFRKSCASSAPRTLDQPSAAGTRSLLKDGSGSDSAVVLTCPVRQLIPR